MDLLTKEEFENGFGSHTPMFSGQTKCVRYYMNFKRSLKLLKEIMLKVTIPPSPPLLTLAVAEVLSETLLISMSLRPPRQTMNVESP